MLTAAGALTTGASGAASATGAGSGVRTGAGVGRGTGFAGRGVGPGGGGVGGAGCGGGGAGGAGGAGGVTNSLKSTAGTMISSGRWWLSAPCSAHKAAPCASAMPATMAVLRLRCGAGRRKSEDIKNNSCQRSPIGRWLPICSKNSAPENPGKCQGHGDQGERQCQCQHHSPQAAQAQVPPCAQAQARLDSLRSAATGLPTLHCATTSRAQSSQRPHWVATPSSHWISSKPIPALAWRAISRSETRRQTQTIMATGHWGPQVLK